MKKLGLLLLVMSMAGCANYKMGNTPKGAGLTNVRILYVPTVQNETDDTAVPGPVTNAILQEIDRDGTFRHARKDECDAILEVTVIRIDRGAIRQSTAQFLTTLQFQLNLMLAYRLYDVKEKKEIVPKTVVTGTTTFFVQGDQTESQRQALPLAAQNAAQNLVTALSNRGW